MIEQPPEPKSLDGIFRPRVHRLNLEPSPVVVRPVQDAPTLKTSTKDVLVRSLKTFLQGATAAWLLNGNQLTKAAVIGAIAAGISAVMNVGIGVYQASKN